jgi:hypothetical protein
MNGQQLGVAVGEMQQVDVAELFQVVQSVAFAGGPDRTGIEGEPGGRGGGQDLQEFTAVHRGHGHLMFGRGDGVPEGKKKGLAAGQARVLRFTC